MIGPIVVTISLFYWAYSKLGECTGVKKKLLLLLLTVGLIFGPFSNIATAQSVKKVVIDAGHGGKDSGAVGYGLQEKDLTLKIAQKVNQNLVNNYVVDTKMTRNSDIFLELKERTDIANSWGANLFLSIHINAGGGTGYEDYIHDKNATSEDKKVQAEVNKEINKVLAEYNKNNRGQKKANFHVLRESKMASILVEILFIDNKSDADLLKNEDFLNDMADAISIGVANALALPEIGSSGAGTSSSDTPEKDNIKVSKASGTYIVTAESLNIRTGDSMAYPAVGALKKNTQVKVTGVTSKGWYQFTYKGKPAYVSGAYLKMKPAASTPAAKPTNNQIKVTKASGTYIVTANSLNVRAGNSTKFGSLGSLKKNNQIKVTGKTANNWYRFTFKGKTGYVSGAYLKVKPVKASQSKPKNTIKVTKASGTYKVTANKLFVRSGNGTNYKSIGYLKKNNSIKVTGKTSNGWYRLKFKGKTGYVHGNYLKAQKAVKTSSKSIKPKSNGIKVAKAKGTYRVTASRLNVRSGYTASHSKIGSLSRGKKITVTGKTSNGWYRIKHMGKVGYVSGKYLKA